MKRNLLNTFIITTLILAGCSNGKTPTPAPPTDGGQKNNRKFEILTGNNQSTRIGNSPGDSIKVKLTGDGINVSNYVVEFRGSGCNSDLPFINHFDNAGVARTYYRLAGNIGGQTLQATLLESATAKRVDSVVFNFTGTASITGLNYTACTPFSGAVSFSKSGSGRLFAVFGPGTTYLRYSDDDGISWNPVKGFSSTYSFQAVRSDGDKQVAAYSITQGIYYSPDNGATWQLKNVPFQGLGCRSMSYTPSGKLFFITFNGTFFYSEDNGTNWSELTLAPGRELRTPQEGPGGEFYVFADGDGIYKSTDKGASWTLLPNVTGTIHDDGMFAYYVDSSNGWIYKSAQIPKKGIYLSKDGGNTYSLFFNADVLANFFYVANGVMYFENGGDVCKIDGPDHFTTLHTGLTWTLDGDFIVSNSGILLWKSGGILSYIK